YGFLPVPFQVIPSNFVKDGGNFVLSSTLTSFIPTPVISASVKSAPHKSTLLKKERCRLQLVNFAFLKVQSRKVISVRLASLKSMLLPVICKTRDSSRTAFRKVAFGITQLSKRDFLRLQLSKLAASAIVEKRNPSSINPLNDIFERSIFAKYFS